MTCEIIVMNRGAVVLAADSAVTLTRYNGGTKETRYHKSVNKLYQISNHSPVGMMVYGAGDLQQAPWELVAKEYRAKLANKSFDHIGQYGDDLFNFIKDAGDIFPKDYIERVFLEDAYRAGIVFFANKIVEEDSYQNAKNDAERIAVSKTYIDETLKNIERVPFLPGFDQSDIDDALKIYGAGLKDEFTKLGPVDSERLAAFAIISLYRIQYLLGNSGVVVAGFGDKEYFPAYCQYSCFGNIRGKVAVKREESSQISYELHSRIKGFATTTMVDNFLFGLSENAYVDGGIECASRLKSLASTLGHKIDPALEAIIDKETSTFRDNFLQKCRDDNYQPLTQVVASLPLTDMADLAETLVRLESLKEKVTQPTESVGGPVDVATITRSEGLIWIKRKHFFDGELNPRYLSRLNSVK